MASIYTFVLLGVAAFLANNSAAEGPTKKSFRGTRSGATAEMQRTTFGVCPFRGLGRGSKNRVFFLYVCVCVCARVCVYVSECHSNSH